MKKGRRNNVEIHSLLMKSSFLEWCSKIGKTLCEQEFDTDGVCNDKIIGDGNLFQIEYE